MITESNLSWSGRKIAGYALATLGVAMLATAIGFMVSGLTTINEPDIPNQWSTLNIWHVKSALANSNVSALIFLVGLTGSVAGGALAFMGGAFLYKGAKKNQTRKASFEEEKIKASSKRLKTIALIIGLFVLMFGVGMILSSSLMLNKQIPAFQDVINKCRYIDPSWFDSIQSSWLDPMKVKAALFLTGGVFTTIAGGGLMVAGYGLSSIKERINLWLHKGEKEKQEAAQISADDANM